jgi:hypothetical protein
MAPTHANILKVFPAHEPALTAKMETHIVWLADNLKPSGHGPKTANILPLHEPMRNEQ